MLENNEQDAPKTGIIYVLTHPEMPGLVKIGRTINLPSRLNALFSSSVPLPFVVHHAVEVEDAKTVEQTLFEVFGDKRVYSRREFFRVEPEHVVAAIRLTNGRVVDENHKVGDGEDDAPLDSNTGITEDDIKARDKQARRRRANLRFSTLEIPVGAEITFVRNSDIKATVIDGKKMVEFEGEPMTLNRATAIVLHRDYQWSEWDSVSGAWYWEYQGEILSAIRTRKEEEAEGEDEDDS